VTAVDPTDDRWLVDLLDVARRAPAEHVETLDRILGVQRDDHFGRLRGLAFWLCSVLITEEDEPHGEVP